jgi:phosphinothricin acetyltransferase
VGLHTGVGFTPVGVYRGVGCKHGAWHDVAWFERALAPRIADPPPPRPLPACRDEPAFREALAVIYDGRVGGGAHGGITSPR